MNNVANSSEHENSIPYRTDLRNLDSLKVLVPPTTLFGNIQPKAVTMVAKSNMMNKSSIQFGTSTTTTDLDTSPVLSDMSLPKHIIKIDMQTRNDKADNLDDKESDSTKSERNLLNDENIKEQNVSSGPPKCNSTEMLLMHESTVISDDDSNDSLKAKSTHLNGHVKNPNLHFHSSTKENLNGKPQSVLNEKNRYQPKFPIRKTSMRAKRSSTYASKSTVKAIPIRNVGSFTHKLNDQDDSLSTDSLSSSITTSLSKSFLFGFYNEQRRKKTLRQKQLISKEYWMKDESVKDCFSCNKAFNTFRRKHHCRICGQIFCHACTLLIMGERFGYKGKMRVCYNCYEHVNNYQDSSDEDTDIEEDVLGNPYLDSNLTKKATRLHNSENQRTLQLGRKKEQGFNDQAYIAEHMSGEEAHHIPNKDNNNENKSKQLLLYNSDDAKSLLTVAEDSKILISLPSPPPKMAIPATRQGESLEISFKDSKFNKSLHKKAQQNSAVNSKYSYFNERYSLRDVDMLPSHNYSSNFSGKNAGKSYRIPNGLHSSMEQQTRRIPSISSLKKSLFNYNPNRKSQNLTDKLIDYNRSMLKDEQEIKAEKPVSGQTTNLAIENLKNKNFKFQFNFGSELSGSSRKHSFFKDISISNNLSLDDEEHNSDGSLEDEGTMSIYSSLHDSSNKSSNPIRSTRNSSKAIQRAQASLNRMQNKKKNRKRIKSTMYRELSDYAHSTPNLLSVVSDDDPTISFGEIKAPTCSSLDINKPDIDHLRSTSCLREQSNSPILLNKMRQSLKEDADNRDSYKISNDLTIHQLRSSTSSRTQACELNETANIHMSILLDQVLNDQNIANFEQWINFLEYALKKVQSTILSSRDSNTLDYRQKYIKIKRISGGSIDNSEIIDGIVFSKALPFKTMPAYIANPRILLLMFPLEYQKNEQHFLSIESVFDQEKEYLDKLIYRFTALKPDIIFVGANVSGYALEILNKAGVTVQYNIKPQIIERIARLTEADIAISIDKLASTIKMGECESFEVRTFIYGNISKTYTFLRGCNPSLGRTILLRGDNDDNLEKIKHVTEFMVYVAFSLQLESSFFRDNFIQLSTSFYLERLQQNRKAQYDGYFGEFLKRFNSRILTTSPTVEFPLPLLLEAARKLQIRIGELRKRDEEPTDSSTFEDNTLIKDLGIESTLTFKDIKYVTKFLRRKMIDELQNQFLRKCKQWELVYSARYNMLGTGSHQSITVLYSMISTKTATPCIGPQLVTIDYFWDTDISLGQIIENIVSTCTYPCEQGCSGTMFDHYRSYVHGSGKVDVMLEKFQNKLPKLKNIILTWSFCKKCNISTPILQLSEKTWNYSFGKYLEIMFWSKKKSLSNIGNCTHDFTKDHVKYFGYNDHVVRMEYSKLDVYGVLTPSTKMQWVPGIDIKFKIECYYKILDKINQFYESVLDRLNHVKLDSVPTDFRELAHARITTLVETVQTEKKVLLDDLESLYHEFPGDRHIQLNRTLKLLYDKAGEWDIEFSNFEQTFLPSENDIARITTNQLRKIFKDPTRTNQSLLQSQHFNDFEEKNKRNENPDGSNYSTETDEIHSGMQWKGELIIHPNRSSTCLDKDVVNPHRKTGQQNGSNQDSVFGVHNECIDSTINEPEACKVKSSEIHRNEMDKFDDLYTPETTDSKRNSCLNAEKPTSKVAKLATFFDQIHYDSLSKEFELQRELERLKLHKNRYQIYKTKTSAPIVEVYKDVNDAVEEPLHDALRTKSNEDSNECMKQKERNNEYAITSDKKLNKSLENELETSITRWGENVINKRKEDEITFAAEPGDIDDSIKNETNENIELSQKHAIIPTVVKDDLENQPEKSLLMKALKTFWADRSAYLWKPLVYPMTSNQHIFSDNDVIIRDDEPSSLIAFCLNMTDYKQKMLAAGALELSNKANTTCTTSGKDKDLSHRTNTNLECDSNPDTRRIQDEKGFFQAKDSASDHAIVSVFAGSETLEAIMTKKTAVHLRYQFQDGPTIMSCKIFFSEHFEAFREISNCSLNYIQSLSRCVKWDSKGGKSGSGFLKTLDNRFVLKELSHSELDAFINFAPNYFEYMAQAMFHDLPTSLAKIFGFYQIQVKNPNSSEAYKLDVIIMENLFYSKSPSRIFDLKGSMRNRHVEQTGKENEVLLDENMVEYIYESPIHVREYDKKLLRASLWNDTLFLAKMNVMDYSLVVGIDNENFILTAGIIDFIRTFTWDKKLESWVKEKGLVVGGKSVIKQPTVVTPRQYKNRFREAMERYILMVPDPWYQESG